MPEPTLVTIEEPSVEHREAILRGLAEFNVSRAGPAHAQPLCVAIIGDDGALQGGLYGKSAYDWLVIELVFVPEELRGRGIGAALLRQAEEQAKSRGCIGAWLDTFSFQARGFYERIGYELVGTVPEHPRGGARYFLLKRWAS